MRKLSYRHTLAASYLGYVTQAAVNNLAPLLFVIFQREFEVSLAQIGMLVTINFCVQIVVDLLGAKYVDRLGYRGCAVAAHLLSALGLAGLALFPQLLPNPFAGLVAAVVVYAVGGGLIEVLISPIVEALPGEQKASAMSLLHSFYCWGHMAVVLLSTLYFLCFGQDAWRALPLLWALLPLLNAFYFLLVPLRTLPGEGLGHGFRALFGSKLFWLFLLLMLSSGAAEQSMSQWASLFAETGLRVSKTMGDLLGPCAFALFMGLARLYFGRKGGGLNLPKALGASALLCVCSYLLTALAPWPLLSLVGCGLCGLSVGLMWPGVVSLASERLPGGGTAMFAFLALAGDLGCSSGPGLVGWVSGAVADWDWLARVFAGAPDQAGLKAGLLCALLFPLLLLLAVQALRRRA